MDSKTLTKKELSDPVFSFGNRLFRVVWTIFQWFGMRMIPTPIFFVRALVLRLFGSHLSSGFRIYPSAVVWNPKNLNAGPGSTVGPRVRLYNQGRITLGARVIVSQDATICASTHNYNDPLHPLVLAPITIHDDAWVCAEAFIGPGVTVGEGAVVGARAVLTKDAEPWSVYAGNPAKKIKDRKRFYE